jgi:cell pole-organizing protein PopZ
MSAAVSQRLQPVPREAPRSGNERLGIEPSMEEILASIRRIIADDQAHSLPPFQPDPLNLDGGALGRDTSSITFDDDVSSPEESGEPPAGEPAAGRAEKPARSAPRETRTPEPATPAPQPKPRQDERPADDAEAIPAAGQADEPLLSSTANASAASAFESLSSVVLSRNPRTLDDLVQDMLRPLLKAWLDENLPPLVEKLVRAEIERIARGNRR